MKYERERERERYGDTEKIKTEIDMVFGNQ